MNKINPISIGVNFIFFSWFPKKEESANTADTIDIPKTNTKNFALWVGYIKSFDTDTGISKKRIKISPMPKVDTRDFSFQYIPL